LGLAVLSGSLGWIRWTDRLPELKAYPALEQVLRAQPSKGSDIALQHEFEAEAFSLLEKDRFEELEQILRFSRRHRIKMPSGDPALYHLYRGLSKVEEDETEASWGQRRAALQRWLDHGRTSSALIGMAGFESSLAFHIRGGGWASTVSGAAAGSMAQHLAASESLCREAQKASSKDPQLYGVEAVLGVGMGWERPKMDALLKASQDADPAYPNAADLTAIYLLPRWHGKKEDALALAEAEAARPGGLGEEAYARIACAAGAVHDERFFEDTGFDPARLDKAFDLMDSRYPGSDVILSRRLYFLCLRGERARAVQAMGKLKDAFDPSIWFRESKYHHWVYLMSGSPYPDQFYDWYDATKGQGDLLAVRSFGDEAAQELLTHLASADPEQVEGAIQGFPGLKPYQKYSLERSLGVFPGSIIGVSLTAQEQVKALGAALKSDPAKAALLVGKYQEALGSQDKDLAAVAIVLLRSAGPPARPALSMLLKQAEQGPSDAQLLFSAIDAIAGQDLSITAAIRVMGQRAQNAVLKAQCADYLLTRLRPKKEDLVQVRYFLGQPGVGYLVWQRAGTADLYAPGEAAAARQDMLAGLTGELRAAGARSFVKGFLGSAKERGLLRKVVEKESSSLVTKEIYLGFRSKLSAKDGKKAKGKGGTAMAYAFGKDSALAGSIDGRLKTEKDPELRTTLYLLRVLQLADDPHALAVTLQGMEDAEHRVQAAVIDAYGGLAELKGFKPKRSVMATLGAALSRLAETSGWAAVSDGALRAIGAWAPREPACMELLKRFAESPNIGQKSFAVKRLQELGSRPVGVPSQFKLAKIGR
jgi:hypothetical protein